MKNIHKILFVVCLGLASIGHSTPTITHLLVSPLQTGIDEKVAKMTEVLSLTKEQQTKYKALLTTFDTKKKDLVKKLKTATPEEKKKLQEGYKTSYETELKKILTKEQYAKLDKLAKEKGKKD